MTMLDDALAMLFDRSMSLPVQYGEYDTRGILNASYVSDADGSGQGRTIQKRTLMVMAGSLGVPARDSAITIGGVAYRIRDRATDQGEVDGLHEFWEITGA